MSREENSVMVVGDKYRSHMYGEGEKDTHWRHGAPPTYDFVNKLFEEGRTNVRFSLLSSHLAFAIAIKEHG